MTESRQPCPRCGEPTLPDATICPHCRSEVLFDLWVTAPVTDPRAAYHAARNLESVADLPVDFLTLKRGLEETPGIVVSSVTRTVASACEAQLVSAGVATRIAYHHATTDDEEVRAPRSTTSIARAGVRIARERPGTTLALILGIALVAAILVSVSGERRRNARVSNDSISTQEIANLAEAATVQLSCDQQLGAGFFVAPDMVVTNAHVLCPGAPRVTVETSDGRTTVGRVMGTDGWLDLGLVTVSDMTAVPLELADATHLDRGDPVVMMGSPRGLDFTLSRGIVSHPNRVIMGISYLQVDAAVNPGNSGGPLLDEAGRVVGIVSMMVGSASNLGLALPVNYLFDDPDALLAAYDVPYDRQRWAARVNAATEADRQEVAEARANAARPGVVAAQITGQGSVVVLVVRMAESLPRDEHLRFTLSRSGSNICSPSGIASRWRRVTRDISEQQGSRYLMWLDRHGLAHDVYASPVQLETAGCPGPSSIMGATLILSNGAQYADQVVVESELEWGR